MTSRYGSSSSNSTTTASNRLQEKTFYVSNTVFTLDTSFSDLKILGKGSYGVVVSAQSEKLHKKIAIKKVTPVAKHIQDAKHVLREVRLLHYLGRHENIITLEDLVYRESADELYIMMELMDSDLHHIIQSKQPLTEQHYQHFMYQLFCGLKYLHDNRIIHRDLKPGNLLVSRDCKLRITDFGLARERPIGKNVNDPDDNVDIAMTEHVVTRWYRPPELMLCPDGMYTYAVDIWSCGCIFAELLGRSPLFPGKNFVHQLSLILDVIGSPKDSEVSHITNQEAKKFLQSQAKKSKVPFHKIFPDVSSGCWDLLDSLLVFDPEKRISVDDALKSSFLYHYYIPESQIFPPMPKEFEFSFEHQQPQLSRYQLKQLIHLEVATFRKEKFPPQTATTQQSGAAASSTNAQPTTNATTTTATNQQSNIPTRKPGIPQRSNSVRRGMTTEQAAQNNNKPETNAKAENDNESIGNNSRIPSYAKGTTATYNRSNSAPKMRPSSGNPTTASTVQTGAPKQTIDNKNFAKSERDGKEVSANNKDKLTNNIDKLLAEVSKPDAYDTLFSPKPRALSAQLGLNPSNIGTSNNLTNNNNINNQNSNVSLGQSNNRKSTPDLSRLSLDDANITSKYEKIQEKEANLKVQDIERLNSLLPQPPKEDPSPMKSSRLQSSSHMYTAQPSSVVTMAVPTVHGFSQAVKAEPEYPMKNNNSNKDDLISLLDNNAIRKSIISKKEALEKEKAEYEAKEKENYSIPFSPSRAHKKSIIETYTSPRRVVKDENNIFRSPKGDKRQPKDFPVLQSPDRRGQENSKKKNFTYVSDDDEDENRDDEEEEADLKTLRARYNERKSLTLSKEKTTNEETRESTRNASNEDPSSMVNNVFRASWKNLRPSSPQTSSAPLISSAAVSNKAEVPTTTFTNISRNGQPQTNKVQQQNKDYHSDDHSIHSHHSHNSHSSLQKTRPSHQNQTITATTYHQTSSDVINFATRIQREIPLAGTSAQVPPPPVPNKEKEKEKGVTGAAAGGDKNDSGNKKRLTVPKSPKFSTMSWQRRQSDFDTALRDNSNNRNVSSAAADPTKKRSISVGKTRGVYL